MKKKVTIYDVAEAADVSLATVSRVINGSNVVKPATRERVLETIKRLDFKPNQIARGLATSKTTTIAVVFPQSLFGHVKDMIGGIGDTGRTLDFNIIMYTTDELGLGNPIEEVIEKVIKSTNFDDYESLNYFQNAITTSGLTQALKDAGIKPGDGVSVNGVEFEFFE